MFEISELKAKKLPELQEIAKASGVPKYRSLKKLDLVYKILDHQAANPQAVKAVKAESSATNNVAKSDSKIPAPFTKPACINADAGVGDVIADNSQR